MEEFQQCKLGLSYISLEALRKNIAPVGLSDSDECKTVKSEA